MNADNGGQEHSSPSGASRVSEITSRLAHVAERSRKAATATSETARQKVSEASHAAGRRLLKVKENLKVEQKVAQVAYLARNAPHHAEEALLKSRTSRLTTEEKNKNRSAIQKMMSSTGGKVIKSLVEMIPSPVGYGPGDIITGLSAIMGKDVLSGEHLDPVDRVIHGIATAIPGVPATPFVEVARKIRHSAEDTVHARKEGKDLDSVVHAKGAWQAVRALKDIIKPPKTPKL